MSLGRYWYSYLLVFALLTSPLLAEPPTEIRRMKMRDVDTILEIQSHTDGSQLTRNELLRFMQENPTPYVFVRSGKVLGWAGYESGKSYYRIAHLRTIPGVEAAPILKGLLGQFRYKVAGGKRTTLVIAPGAMSAEHASIATSLGFVEGETRREGRSPRFVFDTARENRIEAMVEAIQSTRWADNFYTRLGMHPNSKRLEEVGEAVRRSGLADDPNVKQAWDVISDEIRRPQYDLARRKDKELLGVQQSLLRHLYLPEQMDPYRLLGVETSATSDEVLDAYNLILKANGPQSERTLHAADAMKVLLSPRTRATLDLILEELDPVTLMREQYPALLARAKQDSARAIAQAAQREAERADNAAKPILAKPFNEPINPASEKLHERLGVPANTGHENIYQRYVELKARRGNFSAGDWKRISEAVWILSDSERSAAHANGKSIERLLEESKRHEPNLASEPNPQPKLPMFGVADPDQLDLFARLGVSRNTSTQTILDTYAALMERNRDVWTPEQFGRVRDAKTVLTTAGTRKVYENSSLLPANMQMNETGIERLVVSAREEVVHEAMSKLLKRSNRTSVSKLREKLVPLLERSEVPNAIAEDLLNVLRQKVEHGIYSADEAESLGEIFLTFENRMKELAADSVWNHRFSEVREIIEKEGAKFRPAPTQEEAIRAFWHACQRGNSQPRANQED